MDSVVASFGFLCLAGLLAVAGANSYLKQAQEEFQSRLRNAALARARHLLLGALMVWSGAVALAAFGTPDEATAAAKNVRSAPAAPPVQLQVDEEINFTGR